MVDIGYRAYQPEGVLITTWQNKELISSVLGLERARVAGTILEARAILCDNRQNLIVDLNGIRGVIPREEAAIGSVADGQVRDIAIITRVGKPVCFKVLGIEYSPDGVPEVMLSRRAAQEEAQRAWVMKLRSGDIIDARITHFEPFGCFVDIGCGIVSLLTIDAISVSRISHPSDRFAIGQTIRVVVRGIDEESCKVTLTHKELLGTWEENAAMFKAGQTSAGIVRSVEPYGIFIELSPNLAGLAEYKQGVSAGQNAAVYIKSIIPERMKVKLVLIDVYGNAQTPARVKYFAQGDRIRNWRYSPEGCEKEVYTEF